MRRVGRRFLGTAGAPFGVGWNVSGSVYFTGGGQYNNRMYEAARASGTYNANGMPQAGASSQYLIIGSNAYEWWRHKSGTYVIKGTGTGATVTTLGSGITNDVHATTNGVAFRRTVTVIAFPEPTGDAAVNWSPVTYLQVDVSAAGVSDMNDLKVCHVDDETALDAGGIWTQDAITMWTTTSGGYLRGMEQMGPNYAWVETASDLGATTNLGSTGFGINTSTGLVGSNRVRTVIPEHLSRMATDTNIPLWVTPCPMMSDAALTSFFTRLHASYPAGLKLVVEGGNEPWNSSFPQNYGFLRNHYGTASYQNTGLTGSTLAQNQNTAHFSLRCWAAAEAVFGRSRVIRFFNVQLVNISFSNQSLDYLDPGFISAGVAVGALADVIGPSTYWQLGHDDLTYAVVNTGRGITSIPRQSLSLSRRLMIKNKVWIDGAINGNDADNWYYKAWKNGVDNIAGYVALWRDSLAGDGYAPMTLTYEGGWSHDDSPHFSTGTDTNSAAAGLAGLAMAFNTGTGAFTPVSATVGGFAFTDAGEAISDFFEDGSLVRVGWAGSTGITENRTYLCKIISGALYLYTNTANYDADTRYTTGGSNGNVMVHNSSRMDAHMDFLMGLLWDNTARDGTGENILEYNRRKMMESGLRGCCVFQCVGNATTSFRNNSTAQPWATKPDSYGAADTNASTWIRTRALR